MGSNQNPQLPDELSQQRQVVNVLAYEAGELREGPDEVAKEEPLEIRVRGRGISVTMRTPGQDAELAAGFLLTEGLIRRREEVLKIEACPQSEEGNRVDVLLAPDVVVDFDRLTRHVFASSSCGLCGKVTIEAVRGAFGSVTSNVAVTAAALARMPETMRATQQTFARTGGLHAAGVFEPDGTLVALREDVGRHNAVDKVLGFALLQGLLPLGRHVLLVSGRSSFEIMQKALAAGVAIVAAVSAPSSLAVSFAAESGQTLVGFLRGERMNVYSHPRRIVF
jgi:FdhD protein